MRRQRGRVIHHPLRPETRTENAQSTTNVTSNSLSTALFSNLDQVQIASQLPSHRTESWYRTIEKKSHPPCTYLTSFFPGICRLACVRPVPWPQATPLRDGHPESTASTITPLPDVDAVLSSLKLVSSTPDPSACLEFRIFSQLQFVISAVCPRRQSRLRQSTFCQYSGAFSHRWAVVAFHGRQGSGFP
ncbi:hypothetical protein CC2G_001422 [Coprinopsis cinerea AmutBmut pab1-1]|nr:hypothetical protein CC2G_001422 [Coprinopsis cinerea AmutBmut pab1-1]